MNFAYALHAKQAAPVAASTPKEINPAIALHQSNSWRALI